MFGPDFGSRKTASFASRRIWYQRGSEEEESFFTYRRSWSRFFISLINGERYGFLVKLAPQARDSGMLIISLIMSVPGPRS